MADPHSAPASRRPAFGVGARAAPSSGIGGRTASANPAARQQAHADGPCACAHVLGFFRESGDRRVAALGEALSLTFRVALVQTVSRRPLTIPHDLSRPPHRQRRPDRSSRRPDSFSRPTIWRSWRRQRHSRCPGRSGPSTAVSCISRAFRAFRAFNGRPRLLYQATAVTSR